MSAVYDSTPKGFRPKTYEAQVRTARVATGNVNPSRGVIKAARDGKSAAYAAYQADKSKS